MWQNAAVAVKYSYTAVAVAAQCGHCPAKRPSLHGQTALSGLRNGSFCSAIRPVVQSAGPEAVARRAPLAVFSLHPVCRNAALAPRRRRGGSFVAFIQTYAYAYATLPCFAGNGNGRSRKADAPKAHHYTRLGSHAAVGQSAVEGIPAALALGQLPCRGRAAVAGAVNRLMPGHRRWMGPAVTAWLEWRVAPV